MATLTLPPPVNGATSNGTATPTAANGDDHAFVEGLIYPPPEIRSIVDKTAAFIAKNANPTMFEDKIRQRERTDTRFSFLNPTDAYHAYYKHKVAAIKAGTDSAPAAATTTDGNASTAVKAPKEAPPLEPAPLDFLIDMPTINAVDLDIIRLTALFTARSGRKFTSDLAARESRNYQFDFLRPSHSLFPYFNKLVEQYTKVLIPNAETSSRLERMAGGKPTSKETELEISERQARGRREVLKEVTARVKWEQWEGAQQKQKDDEEEKERVAFGEIDWQDFTVVSTVEFTDQDQVIDLPPPMSVTEVENMTITQKRIAAMRMEGKEVVDAAEADAADEAEADVMLAEAKHAAEAARREVASQLEEEGGAQEQTPNEIKKVSTTVGPAGMKIRKDYVPKSKTATSKLKTTTCQICGQLVAIAEIDEHMRIELLDPRWKEKKRATEANRSASTMITLGSDVSSSLRALAQHRTDIFAQNVTEEEKKRREEEADRLKKAARDKYTWDGHAGTGERITNAYQSGANLDEQIEALHRAKGLTGDGPALSGPQIGPVIGIPTLLPPSLPTVVETPTAPTFAGGATLSAAPQFNTTTMSRPPPIDPGRAAMLASGTGTGIPQPPPGFAPPNLPGRPNVPDFGAPMPAGPPPITFKPASSQYPVFNPSTVRPADGQPDEEHERNFKKSKNVNKLPDGQLYPEETWLSLHPEPINLVIRLPLYDTKPEWGCDGSEIQLLDVPLTHFVGTLRDRLQHAKGIPLGRQQLRMGNKILANQISLASLNIGEGDVLTLQIKDPKKK